jgi:hypothetical protein
MRLTGLGSGIDKDRPDYTVFTGEWEVGRIYQTRGGPKSLRWFWSMNANGPMTRVATHRHGGHHAAKYLLRLPASPLLCALKPKSSPAAGAPRAGIFASVAHATAKSGSALCCFNLFGALRPTSPWGFIATPLSQRATSDMREVIGHNNI